MSAKNDEMRPHRVLQKLALAARVDDILESHANCIPPGQMYQFTEHVYGSVRTPPCPSCQRSMQTCRELQKSPTKLPESPPNELAVVDNELSQRKWLSMVNAVVKLSAIAAALAIGFFALHWSLLRPVNAALRDDLQAMNQKHEIEMLRDYARRSRDVFPFDLGDRPDVEHEVVEPMSTLNIAGTIWYPRECKFYWIAFLQDGRVWPKFAIRNGGWQSQPVEGVKNAIAVPRDFNAGDLVLIAASDAVNEKFDQWLTEGHDGPLNMPAEFELVLKTSLTTK